MVCTPCGSCVVLNGIDKDDTSEHTCNKCKQPLQLVKLDWKATGAKAKAMARIPWKPGDKAARGAKEEEVEAKARLDKLARAFDEKTLDPKLETELRDLRNRFEKKTGKSKESQEIDTSTTAENKALADQQRSNNTIKWAEKKTEAERRATKAAEEKLD